MGSLGTKRVLRTLVAIVYLALEAQNYATNNSLGTEKDLIPLIAIVCCLPQSSGQLLKYKFWRLVFRELWNHTEIGLSVPRRSN